MPDQALTCPHCGKQIQLTEAFTRGIEEKLMKQFESERKRAEGELQKAFEAKQQELRESYSRERAKLEAQAKQQAQEALSVELADLKSQLQDKAKQLELSKQQELELRKRQRDLEERERNLRLEVERTVDAERAKIWEEALVKVSEEQRMKEREKDKQLSDMRVQIEELKRKAELTSQQAQGEVQEIELEEVLARQFRLDLIEPVAKGVRGADILQRVNDDAGRPCGNILWESKRTKAWSDGWVQKLKDDQRTSKAEIAVLVTAVLPKEIQRFGYYEGLWVTDFASVGGLATALRVNLIQVHHAGNSVKGKNDKMEHMYAYLSGTSFKQRVEAIVESFSAMKEDLEAEKRAMIKLWSKREGQISRVIENTAGMYGDLQGIIGSALPDVKILELPSGDPDPRS